MTANLAACRLGLLGRWLFPSVSSMLLLMLGFSGRFRSRGEAAARGSGRYDGHVIH